MEEIRATATVDGVQQPADHRRIHSSSSSTFTPSDACEPHHSARDLGADGEESRWAQAVARETFASHSPETQGDSR